MSEILLITVTGEDKPGLTAAITARLGDLDVDILDVGQAVIHSYLSLGIRVSLPGDSRDVLKELLFQGHELGFSVRFSPVAADSYDKWVGLQGRSRFILTLLARRVKASHLAQVSRVVAEHGLNIDNISRLSGRVPLEAATDSANTGGNLSRASVEFSLRGEPDDPAAFRTAMMNICGELDIDVAVQEDSLFRRHRRLVAFDMDSTLIDTEVIDELAVRAGVGDAVSAVTTAAMNGEMEFAESLALRVALLAGLSESVLADVAASLPLMEGAERLFRILRQLGYKTAILSGGFTYFGAVLKARLGIDYVYANELEICDGKLTGRVVPPVVDANRKATLLAELAEREGISLEQCIAVGDGANDLAMLSLAGLGIAFHAKPLVKERVKQSDGQSIANLGLDSMLYLMGLRDRDLARARQA
jgi:phosphoserine phosphatase